MEKSVNMMFKRLTVILVAVCAMLLSSQKADAQQIAVKTNALYWLGLAPNIGCEIVTGEHSSVDFMHWGIGNHSG